MECGEVIYQNETIVKYRRFKKNATAEGQSFFEVFLWRVKNLVSDNGIKDIKVQQLEYKKMFYSKLSEENKKILDIFVLEKYNFFKVMVKIFDRHKLRRKLADDLMVRCLFLFGLL